MIDEALYDDGSGGKSVDDAGGPVYTNSLYTAIYLSMFGGNKNGKWWANENMPKERLLKSETELVLSGKTITSDLLAKAEMAVKSDTDKFNKYGIVTYSVVATGNNRIEISVYISGIAYEYIWDTTLNEPITYQEI